MNHCLQRLSNKVVKSHRDRYVVVEPKIKYMIDLVERWDMLGFDEYQPVHHTSPLPNDDMNSKLSVWLRKHLWPNQNTFHTVWWYHNIMWCHRHAYYWTSVIACQVCLLKMITYMCDAETFIGLWQQQNQDSSCDLFSGEYSKNACCLLLSF